MRQFLVLYIHTVILCRGFFQVAATFKDALQVDIRSRPGLARAKKSPAITGLFLGRGLQLHHRAYDNADNATTFGAYFNWVGRVQRLEEASTTVLNQFLERRFIAVSELSHNQLA